MFQIRLFLVISTVIILLILFQRISHTESHFIKYIPRSPMEENIQNPKGFKPVVIIHGLLDPKSNLKIFTDTIKEVHPGTEVIFIDLFAGVKSFAPLWEQVASFREEVEKICALHPGGIHMIAISQGGLIGRGIIESSDNHNVKTFASVVGPQLGQYGLTEINNWPFYKIVLENVHRLFYSRVFDWFSVAEFWRDPARLDEYKEKNVFLPILNNEIEHSRSAKFKENFLRIQKMILIGGPDDGIITPWQSSQFSFFDEHGNIAAMEEQEVYKNDTFGLRTLNERGAIIKYTIANIEHKNFERNVTVMKEFVIPHLD